jgi:hypothetical protein
MHIVKSSALLIALFCAVPLSISAAPTAATAPRIALEDDAPLVVAGRGFRADETVVVSAVSGGVRKTKTVRAGDGGGFRARFRGNFECGPLYVTAVGREGSRAALRRRGVPGPCGVDG